MTCENCKGYGTVWFDHKAKKWKHGQGDCGKPFPKGATKVLVPTKHP